MNNVAIDCTTMTRTRNTFGYDDQNVQNVTSETCLPLPPSPSLVAELSTNNNISRIPIANSNDGVTSFIEKTSKLLNVSTL